MTDVALIKAHIETMVECAKITIEAGAPHTTTPAKVRLWTLIDVLTFIENIDDRS